MNLKEAEFIIKHKELYLKESIQKAQQKMDEQEKFNKCTECEEPIHDDKDFCSEQCYKSNQI